MSQSKLVKFPGPGCIVEFLHSGLPLIAWVLEEQAGKLRLYTISKRDLKLATNRLLPWSGPAYPAGASRSVMEEAMGRHQAARLEAMRSIDPLEIWELAQGEVGKATAEWFAGLVSEAPGPDEVAAMGRCLLEAKSHFRFQPPDFEVFEADVVARRQAEQEATRLRERLAFEGQEFFRELWACKTSPGRPCPKEPDEDVTAALRELLLARIASPDDERTAELWTGLRKGLPDHPFLALMLAEAWGIVPPHYNYLLDRADYEPGDHWSTRFVQDIEEHRRMFAERLGALEETEFVSIDSPTTRDIDDAFFIKEDGESGGFRLSIALACPALTWEFGSPLDLAVADRATSLYLPEGSSHMLPEALGTDLYSLLQGEPRPALVLDFVVSAGGKVRSVAPRLAVIRVRENISYESAEARIASGEDKTLVDGFRLAQGLRARRLERGAIVIDRPEPKIILGGAGDPVSPGPDISVDIELEKPTPNSQLLVSELMILANAGSAIWAAEHGIPLLYRSQEVSSPAGLSGVWERPEDIQRVVRQMGCTTLDSRPAPHASLAVPAYSPLSSPLRRYPDLLNLAQIQSFLTSGTPRLDRAGLERLLPGLVSRLDAAGQVQRFRPRYWKLVYFRQRQKNQTWQGVIVEENGPFVSVSIPLAQVYIRAPRELFGERAHVGHTFQIKLGKIDPLTNEMRIAEAWEE